MERLSKPPDTNNPKKILSRAFHASVKIGNILTSEIVITIRKPNALNRTLSRITTSGFPETLLKEPEKTEK